MSTPLAVPSTVASILRSAAISEIGGAASEISTVAARGRAAAHPEWFAAHLEHFDSQRALLDALGWRELEIDAQIDVEQHRAALVTALRNQLDTELHLARMEPNKQGAERQRARSRLNARAIEAFFDDAGLDED